MTISDPENQASCAILMVNFYPKNMPEVELYLLAMRQTKSSTLLRLASKMRKNSRLNANSKLLLRIVESKLNIIMRIAACSIVKHTKKVTSSIRKINASVE